MNKTAKNTAIYFVGTVVMGVLGLVNTMLLTRILTESAYVLYGFLHNFVTTAVMFLCFGFDTSYSRFYYNHNHTQKSFLLKVMLIPLGLFIALALILAEPSQWMIRQVFGIDFSFVHIALLLICLLFSLLHRFTQLTARMEERAVNYVVSTFIRRFGFVLIIFAVSLFSSEKVEFDWVLISSLVGSVVATGLNLWILLQLKSSHNEEGVPITNREMLAYGFPHMINSVLIAGIPLVEKMIIRSAADDAMRWSILGIYTAATVFQTVVSMLTLTVNNIWNPLVFKQCEKEERFKPILHNFGMAISCVIVAGFSLCVLLRRWLVLILDSNYFDVYIIAPAVCFGACCTLITVIYGSGINITKKTIHHVIEPIIQIVLSAACCYLLIPTMGLIGVGIAVLVSIVVSRTYKILVGLRLYDTGASEHKMWILMGICTSVAFASLFFTSLMADVIMFAVLIVSMLLILNKDLLEVIQTAKTLILPKKNTDKN